MRQLTRAMTRAARYVRLTEHGWQACGLVEAHDWAAVPDEVKAPHVQVDLAGLALVLQVNNVQHILTVANNSEQ